MSDSKTELIGADNAKAIVGVERIDTEHSLERFTQPVLDQQELLAAKGLQIQGENVLALVRKLRLPADRKVNQESAEDVIESAHIAQKLCEELSIPGAVEPSLIEELSKAGITFTYDSKEPFVSERAPFYPTLEDRLTAADQLIDKQLENADTYPYYDLYREMGILHEDESGIPYLILYRHTSSDDPTIELAGGLRDGIFSSEELTELPPSILWDMTNGEGIKSSAVANSYELEFSIDQVRAHQIGASMHSLSPYLSTSRVKDGSFSSSRNTTLTLRVPACVTLPVEALLYPIESSVHISLGMEPKKWGEDREKEVGVMGRIRPEWIIDQDSIIV